MIFLLDKGKTYSYDDLLGSLNDGTTYYPYYKTSDIYSFFVNLKYAKPILMGMSMQLIACLASTNMKKD